MVKGLEISIIRHPHVELPEFIGRIKYVAYFLRLRRSHIELNLFRLIVTNGSVIPGACAGIDLLGITPRSGRAW